MSSAKSFNWGYNNFNICLNFPFNCSSNYWLLKSANENIYELSEWMLRTELLREF